MVTRAKKRKPASVGRVERAAGGKKDKTSARATKRVRPVKRKVRKKDDFVAAAERAFRRVARKLRAEHRRLGLPLSVWKNDWTHRLKV